MEIVVPLVLIILLALGSILFSPISIYFGFNFGDEFSGFARVRLFFFEYKFFKDKKPKPARVRGVKIGQTKSLAEKSRKALNTGAEVFHILVDELETVQKITIKVLKLFRGMVKSADNYFLKISMAGGLGPPDLTGQLFGTVLSLQPVLGSSVSLAYRPDYLDDRMSGEVTAGATVKVYRLLRELLIFAGRLPKIRLLRLYQQLQKGGCYAG